MCVSGALSDLIFLRRGEEGGGSGGGVEGGLGKEKGGDRLRRGRRGDGLGKERGSDEDEGWVGEGEGERKKGGGSGEDGMGSLREREEMAS